MSLAATHAGQRSNQDLLVKLLLEYDQRVSAGQANMLVLGHRCKFCRTPFSVLAKTGRSPVFVKDSRDVVHDLCSDCAMNLLETDTGAREIKLAHLLACECTLCHASFAEMAKKSQTPLVVRDDQGDTIELCPECTEQFSDEEAKVDTIDLGGNSLTRKAIFGILVGELRHTQFKEVTSKTSAIVVPSVQEPEGTRVRKSSAFVRRHPARHRSRVVSVGR